MAMLGWIHIRTDLHGDPAVICIARKTNLDSDGVIGKLIKFWSWVDQESDSERIPWVDCAWINHFLGRDGFAEAMVAAGWLVVDPGGITIPNFDHWLSKSAKHRLNESRRKLLYRARQQADEPSRPCPDSVPDFMGHCADTKSTPTDHTRESILSDVAGTHADANSQSTNGHCPTTIQPRSFSHNAQNQRMSHIIGDICPDSVPDFMGHCADTCVDQIREEKNKNKTPKNPPSGGTSGSGLSTSKPTPEELLEAWNAVPHFVRAEDISGKRKRQFDRRCAEPAFVLGWRKALERASTLPYCRGDNPNGFRAHLDWYLRSGTVQRLLEGAYDRPAQSSQPIDDVEEKLRRQAEDLRRAEERRQRLRAERQRKEAQDGS
jgi:hypothetical protein